MKIGFVKELTKNIYKKLVLFNLLSLSFNAIAATNEIEFTENLMKELKRQEVIEDTKGFLARATPDQKLSEAYSYMLGLSTCVEIRQDYLIQYVSPTEYETAKNNVRRLEDHFEPQLTESTEVLWSKTMKAMQKYGVFETLRNESLEALENDCDWYKFRNYKYTELILGKPDITKDF